MDGPYEHRKLVRNCLSIKECLANLTASPYIEMPTPYPTRWVVKVNPLPSVKPIVFVGQQFSWVFLSSFEKEIKYLTNVQT
ncbi:hypothetical protein DPMN_174300 [Dreissena polymorpha]|uniref:Uncharacterized protein n=1 Tax=Dreissena polymorpha TaxID=45954 RepID=A0A9D4IIG2_DREPO|nr:hypothetical protein DPMN_174300 [Dreissena polymorpha]